jgi:hypothetical protein
MEGRPAVARVSARRGAPEAGPLRRKAGLLELQRLAGNRAVATLLASVQRACGCGGTCGCGDARESTEEAEPAGASAVSVQMMTVQPTCEHGSGMEHDSLGSPVGAVQRDLLPGPEDLPILHEVGNCDKCPGVPAPPACPSGFCCPMDRTQAQIEAATLGPGLLGAIAAKVNTAVVPIWAMYLAGGTGVQNFSTRFGTEFANDPTTANTTRALAAQLAGGSVPVDVNRLVGLPANPGETADIDLLPGLPASYLSDRQAELESPSGGMDFTTIGSVPGNLAGGVGLDQATCPVGASPSPLADGRGVTAVQGQAIKRVDGGFDVVPRFQFHVADTVDLCPGNCGAASEQRATVPMSRWEASGVVGDVPFTVDFSSPPTGVVLHMPAQSPVGPPTPPTPTGPLPANTTASVLHIRQAPDTSSAIVGRLPRGSRIQVKCQLTGTTVDGNNLWDQIGAGFVSDRFVSWPSADRPPSC